jgi:Tfp pilus assembly protein FimV
MINSTTMADCKPSAFVSGMSDGRKHNGRLALSITLVLDARSAAPPYQSVIIAAPTAILAAPAQRLVAYLTRSPRR